MRSGLLVAGVLVVLLAACTSAESGGSQASLGPASTPTPIPTVSPQVSSTAPVVVSYIQSGSTDDQRRSFTLREDGTASLEAGTIRRVVLLSPAEVTQLRQEFRNAGFANLAREYQSASTVIGFTYSLTYNEGGQSKVVVFHEGSILPPGLQVLRVTIQAMIRKVEGA